MRDRQMLPVPDFAVLWRRRVWGSPAAADYAASPLSLNAPRRAVARVFDGAIDEAQDAGVRVQLDKSSAVPQGHDRGAVPRSVGGTVDQWDLAAREVETAARAAASIVLKGSCTAEAQLSGELVVDTDALKHTVGGRDKQ